MADIDHSNINTETSHARAFTSVFPARPKVLVFIEDAVMRLVCCETATHMGFSADHASSISEAREWIRTGLIDIAIIQIPFQGDLILDFISDAHLLSPDTVIISIGMASAVRNVVEAVHRGSSDYLALPFTMEELSHALTNAASRCVTRIEQLRNDSADREVSQAARLVFKSRSMEALVRILPRIAQSGQPVLIAGENGTGKERVARAIHEMSPEAKRPFIAVDCSSPDSSRLEAELMGEYTETRQQSGRNAGRLAAAEGGVVFLDEIGDLPLPLQSKLIQVIRDGEVVTPGCSRPKPLTARIIAASSRDLSTMVSTGTFRKDLFYRLNIVCLRIPPLRDRREDIPLLIAHFLYRSSLRNGRDRAFNLGNDFLRAMMAYDWPGNVRELESVVMRACALSQHSQLRLGDLPTLIREQTGQDARRAEQMNLSSTVVPLREVEHQAILSALTLCGGDKREAARQLGIGRSTLYRKLIGYGHTVEL